MIEISLKKEAQITSDLYIKLVMFELSKMSEGSSFGYDRGIAARSKAAAYSLRKKEGFA
jgi:hypothetical protein